MPESYSARMRRIAKEDRARRETREAEELDALIAQYYPPTPDTLDAESYRYCYSRSIRGIPSPGNATHRASDNCWNRGMRGRTVGIACDADGANLADFPSVAVTTSDGITTVRPIEDYRRARRNTRKSRTTRETAQPEVLRMAATVGYIGNVE